MLEVFKIYKVIIVDDELASRNTLEKYIKDFCKDFEIAGIFCDGEEAIEFLKKDTCDIVLTDVRMPNVSGIEIAKYINENKINSKVVIVSGYSEFKYAQEAMQYDVSGYLLKVLNIKEFLSTMDKIKKQINDEKKYTFEDVKLNYAVFFYDLFGKFFESEEDAVSAYKKLNSKIPYKEAVCEIIVFEIERLEEFLINEWRYDADIFEDTLSNLIKMLYGSEVVVSVKADKQKFTFIILHKNDCKKLEETDITKEIFNVFNLSAHISKREFINLNEIFYDETFDLFDNEEREMIKASKEIEEMSFSQEQIVDNVNRYIEENFKKNITRGNIAENMFLNEDYLGRIYKNVTGNTILEYLLEVRMSNAQNYIKQGMPVGKVCEKIGYTDERNFRRAFRKYTGFSVMEYKKWCDK